MLPFLLFVGVFLGVPLYVVVHGALTTDANGFTLSQFLGGLQTVAVPARAQEQPILSLWTSIGPAMFGLWLAAAVVAGKPNSLLRRVVSSASGVFAYFAGLPLAFALIASIGAAGVITVFLQERLRLSSSPSTSASTRSRPLASVYFYFQIPLMVILITPSLEGLRPEWE